VAALVADNDRLAAWWVRRLFRRLAAEDWADALQEARAALVVAAGRFQASPGRPTFGVYAATCIRNRLLNWWEIERRRGLRNSGGQVAALPRRAGNGDRDRAFDRLEAVGCPVAAAAAAEVWAGVDRLPERRRLAILYRFRDGLTLAEVAARLGVSRKGVAAIVDDALIRLRRLSSPNQH
jgi:RNA polymerase sigma factor (sigma-70 family)